LATEPTSLSNSQLGDLATLLAASLGRGNINWLAASFLGRDVLAEAGNELNDTPALARRMIAALHQAGHISDAVSLLRREGHPNSYLIWGLGHILSGGSLQDKPALQKFVNEYQPFLNSAEFQKSFNRVSRTVCAIGLGEPYYEIRGTGFLIAPDLVMTNYHVLPEFMQKQPDGTFKANAPGDHIFCFFDYLSTPAPAILNKGAQYASTWVTGARVWYSVSTAHGSSGGAAVDSEGHLFALHNAAVADSLNQGQKMNQGVRIDNIAKDIATAHVALSASVAAGSELVPFWSLNDDPNSPEPIIGRSVFRRVTLEVHESGKPRVLAVTGPPGRYR
jgi:hypothetical protein